MFAALCAFVGLAAGSRDARADGADVVRLPGVEISGMPRTYVTITIAIPEALRNEREVAFDVRLSGLTDVVGRTEGVLRPSENRRVLLTLRVPAEALVGILDVADVVFRGASGDEYVVPIFLRVPAVRGYSATGAREFRGLRAGDRVELAYHVTNHGNAPDTLEYAVRTPGGWVSRPVGTRTVVVPARSRVEIPAAVTVPAAANVGDHTVGLWIRPHRDTVARREVSTVLGVSEPSMQNGGFIVRPRVAMASGGGDLATVLGAELVGPVADGVTLAVRASSMPRTYGLATQGLSAVGATSVPLSGTLAGRDWVATAGAVGAHLGDLTGTNITGQGVQVSRDNEEMSARVIVAGGGAGGRSSGAYVGASYAQQEEFGRLGGGVAVLREEGPFGRELSALGVEYTSNRFGTLVAGGDLALRSSRHGSGVGAGVSVMHSRPGERASLRFSHAPGGSAAFARAVNDLQASASRLLTERWSADVFFGSTRDNGSVVRDQTSRTFVLGQRYRVSDDGNVSLRYRDARNDARRQSVSFGGFGSSERSVAAGTDWRLGEYGITAEVEQGVLSRRTELLDGSNAEATSGRRSIRVDGSREFDRIGNLAVGGSLHQTGGGVGLPTESWATTARWSSLPVLVLGRPAQFNTTIGYNRLGSTAPALSAKGSVRSALPGGVDLVASIERNPYFRDARGRVSTVFAVGLATSSRIFSAAMLGPDGWVFEDRNRNGVRDPGEPGVGGVTVRRGSDRVVSRRDGRYRLPAAARGRTQVEIASIPAGLVAHPTLGADAVEIRDVPLLPTGHVSVRLELTPDESGRVPAVDLSQAVVLLKDDTGFEWVGRASDSATVVFDGIPTGRYTLRVDGGNLREPVRVPTDITVDVLPHERSSLRVPVRGRQIRIITPPGRGGSSGRVSQGSPRP